MFEHALQHLPHGPEFRFLDRLTSLEPGRAGQAEYTLKGNEHFLKGHFPGDPLMPGVLLIEAAAQLAGVVAQTDPQLKTLPGLKLTGCRAVKILGTARPGETLILNAVITGRFQNLVQADASAEANGKKILEATITLSGGLPEKSE